MVASSTMVHITVCPTGAAVIGDNGMVAYSTTSYQCNYRMAIAQLDMACSRVEAA